jgi:hypothetical protein
MVELWAEFSLFQMGYDNGLHSFSFHLLSLLDKLAYIFVIQDLREGR